MKKILIILLMAFNHTAFAQNNETGEIEGRTFRKVIENNLLNNTVIISDGKVSKSYNLNSKTAVEKLMFGDLNAMIEFFVEPSFDTPYGLRIVRDSANTGYIIESKCISNWKEVTSDMSKKYPSIGIAACEVANTPKEKIEQTAQYNRTIYATQRKEGFKHYIVDTMSVQIKDDFVKKLYGVISSMVKNFVMEGVPASMFDGNSVTFRCVVGDEVWTLTIQEPEGVIGQLTGICTQIIKDVETNTFNESKYLEALDDISQTAKAVRE
jgi:hypothetical protein